MSRKTKMGRDPLRNQCLEPDQNHTVERLLACHIDDFALS